MKYTKLKLSMDISVGSDGKFCMIIIKVWSKTMSLVYSMFYKFWEVLRDVDFYNGVMYFILC